MASEQSKSAGAEPIRVTLLRNRKKKSILYMEAGKDFVDLLFSFLTLPTGTVLRLLAESKPIGAIANIFESVKQLENKTFYVDKDVLLDQKPYSPAASMLNNILQIESAKAEKSGTEQTYYGCPCEIPRILILGGEPNSACRVCRRLPSRQIKVFVDGSGVAYASSQAAGSGGGADGHAKPAKPGYVKKSLTYTITDDLQIRPASTIHSIMMPSKLKVEAMGDLESFQTTVGPKEALALLQSSLCSKCTLNDVFGSRL